MHGLIRQPSGDFIPDPDALPFDSTRKDELAAQLVELEAAVDAAQQDLDDSMRQAPKIIGGTLLFGEFEKQHFPPSSLTFLC